MQNHIDRIEQLDLPHLKADDLKWMYSTGHGITIGSGRDKKHFYRRGIQTPIGDIELSVWIKAAEYVVERDGLQEELEHLCPLIVTFGNSLYAKQLSYANQLAMCLSEIYRNPAWVCFVPYNEQHHPELLRSTPMIKIMMDCCNVVCSIPEVQLHKEDQTAHCPVCGRWASFSYAGIKKSE